MRAIELPTSERERLLVVNDPGDLAKLLRRRYPQFDVAVSPSYLSGVAALNSNPTRGLLIGVDPTARKITHAIAGLRKAAGTSARVILCCQPSGEPVARAALSAGADDYVIYPPQGDELDLALAMHVKDELVDRVATAEVMPSWEELEALASVLSNVGGSRRAVLDRLCRLLSETLRTAYVCIATDDTAANTGDPGTAPALVETIVSGGRTLGKILIGPRQRGPFAAAEVEKLRHYSRLIAHLLDADEQQRRWQSLAMIDEATQLPNRRYLMQVIESLLGRAAIEKFAVTVLIFDLDGFKHFNDAYGHAAGDQILRETGQLFRRHCRQHDIVARYAGDEFVVVFWDAEQPRVAGSKHPTDVLAVLRRFKKSLEAHEFPLLGPEATGHITISGGLASFPWDAKDPHTLIDRADQALLQAKRAGKNRVFLVGAEGQPAEDLDTGSQASSG